MANKKTNTSGKTETLLVELLTEELPPKSLRMLGDAFADQLVAEIVRHRLKDRIPRKETFATPRRLAVLIPEVRKKALESEHSVEGPVSSNKKAVEGFARKHQVTPESLERRQTEKGEIVVARFTLPGVELDAVLATIIDRVVKKLPVSKIMRWGTGDAQFVRPVHGLVMMHGSRVIPGEVLGQKSGDQTLGHRFLSSGRITIKHARDYEQALLNGKVVAGYETRQAIIINKINKLCGNSATPVASDALYGEIAALVEAPEAYAGEFSPAFLEVPEECLILSMQQHQKYVPLRDKTTGKLLPRFLFVSNIAASNPREIVHGNERVLRARLSDAKFFYDQDRKIKLEDRVQQLASVVYHNKLGSQLERVKRLQSLSGKIADGIGADSKLAERAARLSKADLLTEMVGEFPELQGTMGRYYALHNRESIEVADAIEQHYRPRFAGDQLPEGPIACVLAFADKLEAIAGMFGIGQQPTGDKDPFALRRQALGVVRILIEKKLDIRLQSLVDLAIAELPANTTTDWLPVLVFLLDRARSYFGDQGFAKQAIEAVIQPFGAISPLYTLSEIVAEASRFIATEEGKILAEANKRITNILKKSGFEVPFGLRPEQLIEKPKLALFKEKVEIEFWDALQKIGGESVELRNQHRFAESLRVLSQLGKPTKSFFDGVLVNAEEPDIRENRITLLQHARAYMNQVAELSLMAQ